MSRENVEKFENGREQHGDSGHFKDEKYLQEITVANGNLYVVFVLILLTKFSSSEPCSNHFIYAIIFNIYIFIFIHSRCNI